MKKKVLSVLLLVLLILPMGGCNMNSYDYYDGLSLPTEMEMLEMNADLIEGYESNDLVCPWSLDIELAKEKGLDDNGLFGEKYFYMQAIYQKALDAYLVKKLNLEKYDNELKSYTPVIPAYTLEGINYPILGLKDKQNYYQRHSMMGLTYLYLRSDINIERLNVEDLELLEECYINKQTNITPEIQEMVNRTYPTVIKVHTDEELEQWGWSEDTLTIRYAGGEESSNNALVLEIATGFPNEVTDEEYDDMQHYIYEEFVPNTSKTLSQKFNAPVVLIEAYPEYFNPVPGGSSITLVLPDMSDETASSDASSELL